MSVFWGMYVVGELTFILFYYFRGFVVCFVVVVFYLRIRKPLLAK